MINSLLLLNSCEKFHVKFTCSDLACVDSYLTSYLKSYFAALCPKSFGRENSDDTCTYIKQLLSKYGMWCLLPGFFFRLTCSVFVRVCAGIYMYIMLNKNITCWFFFKRLKIDSITDSHLFEMLNANAIPQSDNKLFSIKWIVVQT